MSRRLDSIPQPALPRREHRLGRGAPQFLRLTTIVVFLTLALAAAAQAREDIPAPAGRVSDFAHVIGDLDRGQIEQTMLDLERRTGAQIGIVTVRSLEGAPIEDFAARAFEEWGVGHEGRDDGVLVVLAVEEGAVRIEVGYGLEPVLPDGLCGEIIRNTMTPLFEQGDLAGGLVAGVRRIAQIVAAQQPPSGAPPPAAGRFDRRWLIALGAVILLALAAAAWRLTRRRHHQ